MQSFYKANCLIFLLIFLGRALHLHEVSSNYITYLQNQQNTIKGKLDSLSQRLSQNNKNVQKQADIDKKIALLETFLKQERLLLAQINIQTIDQQLNNSEWVCPVLSDQKKKQINNQVAAINQDLKQIGQTLNPLNDSQVGSGINNSKQELKSAQKTADKFKEALASKGTQVNPSNIHPEGKSNLNAPNWILDNKKPDQLNQQYKKSSQSGALSTCSISEPFFSSKQKKCIPCNGQNLFFSLGTQECQKCFNFDKSQHKCKDTFITSITPSTENRIIIPEGKTLDSYKDDSGKITACPQKTPFYTGKQCVQCETFFDIQNKICTKCEGKNHYDFKTHSCKAQQVKKSFVSNIKDSNWSSKKPSSEIQKEIETKLKDPLYIECPVGKPYSNGKQCLQCSKDEYFDLDKSQCAQCQKGLIFDKNIHNCTLSQNNLQTNPQKASNLIFEGHPKNQWMYIYYQNIEKNAGMTDCPKERPYFDGTKCTTCSEENPYFNMEYKKCQKCSQGTKYDSNHHQCLTTQGNIVSQKPTLEKMAAGIFS